MNYNLNIHKFLKTESQFDSSAPIQQSKVQMHYQSTTCYGRVKPW